MKRIVYFLPFLSLMCLFLNISCNNNSITNSSVSNEYFLRYNMSGGVGGGNNTLTVAKSDSASYTSRNYIVHTILDEEKLNEIYNTLMVNNFLGLDSQYLPDKVIMDDLVYTITLESSTARKEIVASGHCSANHCGESNWPDELHTIIDYLQQVITMLKEDVQSGKVTIASKTILEEWPFGDRITLSDHLYGNVGADEEIFNHFKEYSLWNKQVAYYEGEWIYNLNGSGGYGLSYDDLDTFYIAIHDRNEPIQWSFETKLSDIPEEGVILVGSDYVSLKEAIEEMHYPWYFMDSDLKSGEYVYEIVVLHGSGF
ncbi:MAG: hypothetical protein JSV84_14920 [Gemmatimonadota bacterium]|nr:MAG: hypothetical protein JSV84_14920 [Gemmatimonadota bacterium]